MKTKHGRPHPKPKPELSKNQNRNQASHTAAVVNELSRELRRALRAHPLNAARAAEGLNPANAVLLRGCGCRIKARGGGAGLRGRDAAFRALVPLRVWFGGPSAPRTRSGLARPTRTSPPPHESKPHTHIPPATREQTRPAPFPCARSPPLRSSMGCAPASWRPPKS